MDAFLWERAVEQSTLCSFVTKIGAAELYKEVAFGEGGGDVLLRGDCEEDRDENLGGLDLLVSSRGIFFLC